MIIGPLQQPYAGTLLFKNIKAFRSCVTDKLATFFAELINIHLSESLPGPDLKITSYHDIGTENIEYSVM